MTSRCKPIYSNELLLDIDNRPALPADTVFNEARDDPTLRLDMRQVRAANLMAKTIFANSDLTEYPALKERFESAPITDDDFAVLLDELAYNPRDFIDDFLGNYPEQISLDDVYDLVQQIQGTLNDVVAGATPEELTPEDLVLNTGSPILVEPRQGIPGFVPGVGTPPPDPGDPNSPGGASNANVTGGLSSQPVSNWKPSPDMVKFLEQANDFYEGDYSQEIASKVCASFPYPFEPQFKTLQFINAFHGIPATIADAIGDFKKMAGQIANFMKKFTLGDVVGYFLKKIGDLLNNLTGIVDKYKTIMRTYISRIMNTSLRFIEDTRAGMHVYEFFIKKTKQLENAFSDFTMDRLKKRIKAMIWLNFNQYQFFYPEVMETIAYQGCRASVYLYNMMESPIKEFKRVMDRMALNYDIADSFSLLSTIGAVDAGAIRISNPKRENARRDGADKFNKKTPARKPTIEPGNYVTLEMSDKEMKYVADLDGKGDQFIKFKATVLNMGIKAREIYENGCGNLPAWHAKEWFETENKPESGWKMVAEKHPYVYAALKRVAERLQAESLLSGPLLINSAFRSRYYNRVYQRECKRNKKAAWDSFHMAAAALDVSMENLQTNDQKAAFIKFCSQEGFTRISPYTGSNFIHIDIDGSGGRGFRQYSLGRDRHWDSKLIVRAMDYHYEDAHRKGQVG